MLFFPIIEGSYLYRDVRSVDTSAERNDNKIGFNDASVPQARKRKGCVTPAPRELKRGKHAENERNVG
jgi:hypothetical protein